MYDVNVIMHITPSNAELTVSLYYKISQHTLKPQTIRVHC